MKHSSWPTVFWVAVAYCALDIDAIAGIATPYVAWSMDSISGTKLTPAGSSDTRFQGDFGGLGSNPFRPGVVGDAIYVDGYFFKIAKNIKSSDCLRNPDACTVGLSFVFWLNIEEWNGIAFPIIFRTSTATKSLPGIYFGKGEGESDLIVWLRRVSGETRSITFSQSYVWNKWAQIGITWNKTGEILRVFVDGSALEETESIDTEAAASAGFTDFVIGSATGPNFLLDELNVYYDALSSDDIAALYSSVRPGTTAPTKPTTRPTTRPTTDAPTTKRTTTQPTTVEPTTTLPTTVEPTTTLPTTVEPTTTLPTTVEPTTTQPTTRTTPTTSTVPSTTTPVVKTTQNSLLMTHWWILLLVLLAVLLLFVLCFIVVYRRRARKKKPKTELWDAPVTKTWRSETDNFDSAAENDSASDAAVGRPLLNSTTV